MFNIPNIQQLLANSPAYQEYLRNQQTSSTGGAVVHSNQNIDSFAGGAAEALNLLFSNNSATGSNSMLNINTNQIYANLVNTPAFQEYLKQNNMSITGGSQQTTNTSSNTSAPSTGLDNLNIEGQSVSQYTSDQVNNPTMPAGTQYQPVNQTVGAGEMMQGVQLDPTGKPVQAQEAQMPEQFDPAMMEAFINQLPEDVQAQIGQLSQQAQVAAEQGTESEEYKAAILDLQNTLNNAQVSKEATVRYQYEQLMDFDAGETPAWAAGAMRTAMQTMAARGIDASTMAGEAVTTALMQAALPIAQQDAQVFATMDLAILDKKSQLGILRASHLAQLDLTNLNNRQQAAVVNAQAFLQMDLTNLNNRQQAAIVSSQQRLQQMLSNQAAENAARQFNAASENQVNEFFASLSADISKFNAAQQLTADQFNSSLADSREKFNAENAMIIEQANVNYLRQINTANTAEQNKANFTNSQNLLEISNTAMANMLTLFRDRNAFIFEESENSKERALRRVLAEMDINARFKLADKEIKYQTGSAIGGLISDIAGGIFDSIFK